MVAVTMPGGQTFTRLAAGEYHTCGITPAGAAYCWGRNSSGQLGNNSQTDANIPTAVSMPTGVTFKAISLGELHSCAIAGTPPTAGSGTTSSTGRVFCWGDNEYGQLGDSAASGNRSPVLTPKLIVNQP
jgi:alpha-tubulin suppressor-like RCC1 family protein